MTSKQLMKKINLVKKNPAILGRPVNRWIHSNLPPWSQMETGVFTDADWDNLIILDACRYDVFEKLAADRLPGEINKQVSGSSATPEFLRNNLSGRDLRDTVYVTANGHVRNYRDELDLSLHDIKPVYTTGWDDDLNTVPPEAVVDSALTTSSEYPSKRLIIHFVQPHFPFIGAETTEDKKRLKDTNMNFWMRVMTGDVEISADKLWDAYEKTLKMVIPHTKSLLKNLNGKTVVSSDHGNLFGERVNPIPVQEWGHPEKLKSKYLNEVPWLVYQNGARKDIVAEEPKEYQLDSDPIYIEEQLKALGYK